MAAPFASPSSLARAPSPLRMVSAADDTRPIPSLLITPDLPPSVRTPSPSNREKTNQGKCGSPEKASLAPFNFSSTTFTPGSINSSPHAARLGQRRGHRYKHSSVSMNLFEEPPVRAPLPIPESLAVPTFSEVVQSASREQRVRLGWCAVYMAVAYSVFTTPAPLGSMRALAHLLFYDALCALLTVFVEVLANFSVWNHSSICHPFGLERLEVLAGFALAVGLIFMGGDVMSHSIQHLLEVMYGSIDGHGHGHEHGHSHSHDFGHDSSSSWPFLSPSSSIVIRSFAGLVATVVSASSVAKARVINNNALLSNPSTVLSLLFSVVTLIVVPLFGQQHYAMIDTILTPFIAGSMCVLGWTAAKGLAGMLVMSYSGVDHASEIERSVLACNPHVEKVSNVSFWQVHHELWLASMSVVMSGQEEDETLVRRHAARVVQEVLQVYGAQGVRWETTVDVSRVMTAD